MWIRHMDGHFDVDIVTVDMIHIVILLIWTHLLLQYAFFDVYSKKYNYQGVIDLKL